MPTLRQLIDRGQPVLVYAENKTDREYPWYHQQFGYVQETPFDFKTVDSLLPPESCKPMRGRKSNPLFLLNNWVETAPAPKPVQRQGGQLAQAVAGAGPGVRARPRAEAQPGGRGLLRHRRPAGRGRRAQRSELTTRALRLAAQRLSPGTQARSAQEAAAAVCGIQAQDVRAAGLALRSRVPGLTRADVDAAPLVRTWTVRGTVHLIAEEDRPWLHTLCAPRWGPRFETLLERRGGLEAARAMLPDIVDLLADEPRDRAGLLAELAARGHPDLGSYAVNVLVPWASQQGVVVGLADGRLRAADPPAAVDRDEALATMARRYLEGYGPADAEDLARWSGQPLSVARRALEAAGSVEPGADPAPEPPPASLLAGFDTTMLGYRSREWIVPPEHDRRILPGGGMLRPVVLEDGEAVGTWRLPQRGLEVEWFGGEVDVAAEAADVARFLGL